MTRSVQLSQRLREVFLNGTWIANTNFKLQLENVSLKEANQKIGNLNTIALLSFHINYYLKGLNIYFKDGTLDIKDKHSFDMPPIRSEDEWKKLVSDLLLNAETFAKHVEKMTDEKLRSIFVNEKYGTNERNIEGMIEHSYYHLGQISLIRKMIASY